MLGVITVNCLLSESALCCGGASTSKKDQRQRVDGDIVNAGWCNVITKSGERSYHAQPERTGRFNKETNNVNAAARRHSHSYTYPVLMPVN
jgi:hypothetical protein